MNWLEFFPRKGWRLQVLIYQKVNQKYIKYKLVLPMHPMHAQPYHFLACAPSFCKFLKSNMVLLKELGHDVHLLSEAKFLKIWTSSIITCGSLSLVSPPRSWTPISRTGVFYNLTPSSISLFASNISSCLWLDLINHKQGIDPWFIWWCPFELNFPNPESKSPSSLLV